MHLAEKRMMGFCLRRSMSPGWMPVRTGERERGVKTRWNGGIPGTTRGGPVWGIRRGIRRGSRKVEGIRRIAWIRRIEGNRRAVWNRKVEGIRRLVWIRRV